MKITTVTINKLFGYYTYTLHLKNNITIIHGPNGCGKTTMLKIINAVFEKDTAFLKSANFEDVSFTFEDNSILQIYKKKLIVNSTRVEGKSLTYLAFRLVILGNEQIFDSFENQEESTQIIKSILDKPNPLPFLGRLDSDYWIDKRTNSSYNTEEVINKYGSTILRRYGGLDTSIPSEVSRILDSIEVRLIAADRLTVQKKIERHYGGDELKIEQRVAVLANDISTRIKDAIQKYAQISQSKDRTFPLRVIKTTDPLPFETIKEKMIDLEKKRKQFVETGILDEENDVDIYELVQAITEDNRQTLSLYAIDTEEKLNALSNLSESINLFRTLIEKKFTNKKIIFNKEYGFHFVTTYSNAVVLPEHLSSGEQHELVMFYDLIFNTSSNTLVLIDEPELSLHIKWQLEYIDDLLKIISVSGLYTLIATHSPQIIHDNWDITVSLINEE